MKYAAIAIAHSFLSYPSMGGTPGILGLVYLKQRRLSGRMSVDEPSTWLDNSPAKPLQV